MAFVQNELNPDARNSKDCLTHASSAHVYDFSGYSVQEKLTTVIASNVTVFIPKDDTFM